MHCLNTKTFSFSYFKIMYYKKEFISAKINSILLNYFFSIFKFVFNYIPSENKIVIYYNILIDNIVCTCTDNKKVLLVISHSPFFIIHQHDENPACPRQNAVHQYWGPPGPGSLWDLSESPWPSGNTGRGQLHRPPHSTGTHQERLCHVCRYVLHLCITPQTPCMNNKAELQ